MTAGGVAGVPISGFGHYGNFQAKGATDRGEPLSAPAIVGAAAPSSATTPEQRRSALWILASRWFGGWRDLLLIVKPETVLGW